MSRNTSQFVMHIHLSSNNVFQCFNKAHIERERERERERDTYVYLLSPSEGLTWTLIINKSRFDQGPLLTLIVALKMAAKT